MANRLLQRKEDQYRKLNAWLLAGGSIALEANLWKNTGSPAVVRGLFRRTLVFDTVVQRMPDHLSRFILWHEAGHIIGGHFWRLWLARCLFFPFVPWVRRWCETDADRMALSVMPPHEFAAAVRTLHMTPEGWRGALARFIYGRTWRERCERAGIVFDAGLLAEEGRVAAGTGGALHQDPGVPDRSPSPQGQGGGGDRAAGSERAAGGSGDRAAPATG